MVTGSSTYPTAEENELRNLSEQKTSCWMLRGHSELLNSKHATLKSRSIRRGKGDFVYCDPTYTVAHDNNGFVRYNERNFSWRDQERLAAAIKRAHDRGASVLLSNAHHSDISDLFRAPRRSVLRRTSRISRDVSCRVGVAEYLFFWPGQISKRPMKAV